MDIAHLHLHVRDRARSEAFYRDWFALALQRHGESISFLNGDRDFLLALMDDPNPAAMPAWFHFGVALPSSEAVKTLLAKMQAAQVPIVKPLYDDATLTSFRCADPDGYCIECYWAAP